MKEIEFTLDDPVSQDPMYATANAVAVCVLGRVCLVLGNYLIMLGDHFAYWLNHLQCVKEPEMIEKCIDMICTLLERGEVAFVGEASQNILKILQYLCDSVGIVGDKLSVRVVHMLKSIQSQSDPSLFNALWNAIGAKKAGFIKQRLDAITSTI